MRDEDTSLVVSPRRAVIQWIPYVGGFGWGVQRRGTQVLVHSSLGPAAPPPPAGRRPADAVRAGGVRCTHARACLRCSRTLRNNSEPVPQPPMQNPPGRWRNVTGFGGKKRNQTIIDHGCYVSIRIRPNHTTD